MGCGHLQAIVPMILDMHKWEHREYAAVQHEADHGKVQNLTELTTILREIMRKQWETQCSLHGPLDSQ